MAAIGKARKPRSRKQQNIAYLLILPSYLIFTAIVLIPIAATIGMSFTDYNFSTWKFIGFQNYIDIFHDPVFTKSLWNTIRFALYTIIPEMVLALLLAVLLNMKVKGQGVFRTLYYLPNILSMVAVAMAWSYLYNQQSGIINRILAGFGIGPVGWLTDQKVAMISVAIMSVWSSLGYYALLYLAGLQGIPVYLYEAAEVDGANAFDKFIHVTIPGLRSQTFFIFVMACIHSFEVFGQVYILTQGGPMNSTSVLALQVYQNGFSYYKMGYASAMAVILLVIVLIITLINMKFGGGRNDE